MESGPLRASVKISVPLGEHGDLTLIATVVTETPYVSFKADVSRNLLSWPAFNLSYLRCLIMLHLWRKCLRTHSEKLKLRQSQFKFYLIQNHRYPGEQLTSF